MDRIIKNNGLSQYRTMKQILDENRSVFDNNTSLNQRGYDSDDSGNTTTNDNSKKKNKSISLTLEQQSKLKLLQSAYKIATQKEDDGALRRIRMAMDELENDVMEMMKQKVTNNNEDIDSGLSSIRRAMKISTDEENNTVDLLSELEKAVLLSSSSSSSSSSSRLTTSAGSTTTTTMMQSKIVIKTGPFGQPAKSKEEDLELTTQIILDYVNSQMVDAGICDDNDCD